MCIIMLTVFNILLATLGTTLAGYAGSSSNDVGNGFGYGYSGSFSGSNGAVPPVFVPNFDFGNLFNGYIDSLKKYHEHFINTRGPYSFAITYSTPNANVQAQSSITFVGKSRLQQQAQQAQQFSAQAGGYAPGFSAYGQPVYTGDKGAGFGGAGDGGAVASASIGPQGGYQTAAVYPENPNSPNIFSRFGEVPQSGGGGGSYGVFTSSVSSSSNVDGKPQSFHRASTTINDNGKISTYTVKNP